jgi:hypothetical protein
MNISKNLSRAARVLKPQPPRCESPGALALIKKTIVIFLMGLDGVPLGVVLYSSGNKPKYANQRAIDLLTDEIKGRYPRWSVQSSVSGS